MVDFVKPIYGDIWAENGENLSPTTLKISTGWVQEMMPYQWENFLQNRQDRAIKYLMQKGISEWSGDEEYIGLKSFVNYGGNIYICTTTCTGIIPTNTSNWKKINPDSNINGVVTISGGGTGATSAPGARTALGLGNIATLDLPVDSGFLVKDGSGNLFSRTISGPPDYITVENGSGTLGSPVINVGPKVAKLDQDAAWLTNSSIRLPSGTTSQAGVATPGRIRFNLETNRFEGATAEGWGVIGWNVNAGDIQITDSGNYFSSGNIEGALQEVGQKVSKSLLQYDTYLEASIAAATLPNGQKIISPDSDSRLSRFEVQTGALVFVDYLPDVVTLDDYASLRAYTQVGKIVDLTATGIAGRFIFDELDASSPDNGGTVIVGTDGRRWKRVEGPIVERSWFESQGAFDSYSAGNPRVDQAGELHFPVKIAGISTDIADAVIPTASQGRCRVNYRSGNSISLFAPNKIFMGGFRMFGNFLKPSAPIFSNNAGMPAVVSFATNLGVETSDKKSNWYGIFAVANDGDSEVQFKLMPYLRAGTVTGSSTTFTYGGEGLQSHTLNPVTYAMANNSLANCDCLVINEGSYQEFKGRVTKITANTGSQLTLQDIGTVSSFNYLLAAPPGFTHYAYLGSVYMDTAEVRNIADTGSGTVGTYGVQVQDPNLPNSGAIAAPGLRVNLAGYISPLATAVTLASTVSLSTASVGSFAQYFSHDSSNHVVASHYFDKQATTSTTTQVLVTLPFSIGQMTFTYTGGGVQSSRVSATLQVYGYIEP